MEKTFQNYLDEISQTEDIETANSLLSLAQADTTLTDVQLRHITQQWVSANMRIGNSTCELGMGGG